MSVTTENTPPLRAFLELLGWELEEDRESLVGLMGRLGVRRKRVGVIVAWIAEKVGRLRLTGSSPLRTLVELEALDRGSNGKLDMWNVLRSSVGDHVHGIDYDEPIRRAEGSNAMRLADATRASRSRVTSRWLGRRAPSPRP